MDNKTIEDLLMDDGFMAWYHQNDKDLVASWNKWIEESEQNRLLAEEAVVVIHLMASMTNEKKAPTRNAEAIWNRVQAAIGEEPAVGKPVRNEPAGVKPVVFKPLRGIMLRNYLKVGFRNLSRNRVSSFINIFGLSLGMAVTMLIGLWIWDEVSYNTYHENYSHIAQVWQRYVSHGQSVGAQSSLPIPLAAELRRAYQDDFKYVVLFSDASAPLAVGDLKSTQKGGYMEPDGPDLLSLKMLEGSRSALKDPSAILLSASTAKKFFGEADPLGRMIKIANSHILQVAGVYEDLPYNTNFRDLSFIAPWSFFVNTADWVRQQKDNWDFNITAIFVQLAPHADMHQVEEKIKDAKTRIFAQKDGRTDLFLHPMSKWHLYGHFNNGVNTGGLITFVWLFGTIGLFVLLLACINFMNLSTARSEKRAREVGIRKVMGSLRGQLIGQFFSESILMTQFALIISILIVQLTLPWFDTVADKKLTIPWTSSWFWICSVGFSVLTGLIAGSYPALYLSSFQPVKVLKGTFQLGRFAATPRKVLVVLQFTVSVLLITGTMIIYRQIQFAKDRPVGYNREGLISIGMTTPEIYTNYETIRTAVIASGAATEVVQSQGPLTDIWAGSGGFSWTGKDPHLQAGFAVVGVRMEYGNTVGWQFKEGRDFSKAFPTDSNGIVLNEAAAKYIGVANPVGMTMTWNGQRYTVLGVIKNMIMASPYEDIPRTVYPYMKEGGNIITIRINPTLGTAQALKKISAVFNTYNPGAPFEYTFVDQDYAKKFGAEERIGTLAAFFAILAVLISCLGLYGLAAFIAEQRTKEIGIRKVLGATLFQVWQLLSTDFVRLIIIALAIAIPASWLLMHAWLQHYEYRSGMPWWIFAGAGIGALAITIITVSYQAIKAALLNPVKSLRTE